MKSILKIYIAAMTCLTLILPATETPCGNGISIRHRGIWNTGYRSSLDQIDLITTAVSLLAWIAPAAFLLWQWDAIASWIKRSKKSIGIAAGICVIAFIVLAIVGTMNQRREKAAVAGTSALIIPAPTVNPDHILIPTAPATANQVRRASKANP